MYDIATICIIHYRCIGVVTQTKGLHFCIIHDPSHQFHLSLILPALRISREEETKCRKGNGAVPWRVKTPLLHPKGVQSCLPKSPGRSVAVTPMFPTLCLQEEEDQTCATLTHSSDRSMDGERESPPSLSLSLSLASGKRSNRSSRRSL